MADNKLYLTRVSINPEYCIFRLGDEKGREITAISSNCDGNLNSVDIEPANSGKGSTQSDAMAAVFETAEVINDFFGSEAPEGHRGEWEALKAAVGFPIGEKKDKAAVKIDREKINPGYSLFGNGYRLNLSSNGRPVLISICPEGMHTSLEEADPAFQGLVHLFASIPEYGNGEAEDL